jgi:hypothetical protein
MQITELNPVERLFEKLLFKFNAFDPKKRDNLYNRLLTMSSHPYVTMNLIEKYPDVWIYETYGLFSNPNLTPTFIERQPDKYLYLDVIARKMNLAIPENLDFVERNLNKSQLIQLSRNPTLPLSFIERHIDLEWRWNGLSEHPNITLDFIERHIHKPWNWSKLLICCKHIITTEFLERHLDKVKFDTLSYMHLPYVTLEFIERHIDMPWVWGTTGLSRNPIITHEFVKRHMDKPWSNNWIYKGLFLNPNMMNPEFIKFKNSAEVIKFIETHHEFSWKYGVSCSHGFSKFSNNPSLTPEVIEHFIDKPWNWGEYGLSSNDAIPFEFVEKHIDKPWNWGSRGLTRRFEFQSKGHEFIGRHLDKDWSTNHLLEWLPLDLALKYISKSIFYNNKAKVFKDLYMYEYHKILSLNKYLTAEYVIKHLDENWDIEQLIFQDRYHDEMKVWTFTQKYKQKQSIYRIQKWWLKCYYAPHSKGYHTAFSKSGKYFAESKE